MKVQSTLLLAFLVVFHAIDANAHQHEKYALEERNHSHETRSIFSDTCNFICGTPNSPNNPVPAPIPAESSWKIDLSGQASIGVILVYEGNTKSLAFINIAKGIVVVFTGTNGVFGVFNLQKNSGLIININVGVAKYVSIPSLLGLFTGASVNLYAGVYALANAVIANQVSVSGVLNILLQGATVFNFQSFINSVTSGGFDLVAFFTGKLSLYNSVQADFGVLFSAVSTSTIVTQGYSFSFGALNVLAAITGNVAGVSYGFISIVQRFSLSIDGFVNGNLLYNLLSQVSLYSQAFIAGKITGVSLLSDLTLSFTASGSSLFAVTVNGLITVGGAIKGAITEAQSIAGSIIGSSYIGIGVSFQAGVSLSASISG